MTTNTQKLRKNILQLLETSKADDEFTREILANLDNVESENNLYRIEATEQKTIAKKYVALCEEVKGVLNYGKENSESTSILFTETPQSFAIKKMCHYLEKALEKV